MFKKNTAVTGFPIGHFIQTADGAAKTTGTPACKRLLDGVGGTLTNAASYDSTAGVWKIDLAAGDMNGDMVGLVFTLADCLPISYAIRTTTKLVSDLNDSAYAGGAVASVTGDVGGKVLGGGASEIVDIGVFANIDLSAAEIAGAVRTELATELARLDINVSDVWDEDRDAHMTEGSFGAHGEYIPTAAAAAGAVRTELATELAHLDEDVSSRLPTSGYTPPPSAATIADSIADEPMAGHTTPGTAAAAWAAGGAAGDPWEIDLLAGNYVDPDTAGYIIARLAGIDVTAVSQVPASSAGHLTITVGLTFDEYVTGLTIPADWVSALWTLKNNARDADPAALVQLRATNPAAGSDGLQRLNRAAPPDPITADDGALTVTQATGRIDVWLSDEMTAMLGAATSIGWDVKFIDASGDSTGRRGTADIVLTETKATA